MCTSMCSWTPWSPHSSTMYNVCMITDYMSEVEILSWKWCTLSESINVYVLYDDDVTS